MEVCLLTLYEEERYQVSLTFNFVLMLILNTPLHLRILACKGDTGKSLEFLSRKNGVAEVRDSKVKRERRQEKYSW
jgi:hypothetical protein